MSYQKMPDLMFITGPHQQQNQVDGTTTQEKRHCGEQALSLKCCVSEALVDEKHCTQTLAYDVACRVHVGS